jgi:hypothetical protein
MADFKKMLEEIKKRNESLLEKKAPMHFSPKEMPGQADDVYHNCIKSVKAEAKKNGKPMSEQEAAAICEKSRKEGGATLKQGAQRKKEEDRKRKEDA